MAKVRFIPAGAGNTFRWHKYQMTPAVYPRWRGEHLPPGFIREQHAGLSPLARGTRMSETVFIIPVRFIPAGAGNTTLYQAAPAFHTVYPRWRGEHFAGVLIENRSAGLSPLARGTHGAADV